MRTKKNKKLTALLLIISLLLLPLGNSVTANTESTAASFTNISERAAGLQETNPQKTVNVEPDASWLDVPEQKEMPLLRSDTATMMLSVKDSWY